MSNMLVRVEFTVNVSEEACERLVGRPDDGSQEWHEAAWDAAEKAVDDDPMHYLESSGPPDVECIA